VIDPDLGLLYEGGIARLAEQIGFTSRWGHQLDLDHVVKTANAGQPVIVSFPPQPGTLFPTVHILVVVGGNASQVFLADSSSYNFPFMSRSRFLKYWRGFSAVLSPRDGGQQA
jgi:predicted double-glycine peptidase